MRYYPRNLACLATIAAKDSQARFGAIAGVQLTETAEGYTAAATDGRKLAVVTGTNDAPPDKFFELAALASAPNSARSGVVPGKAFAAALKAAPKKGKEEPDTAAAIVLEARQDAPEGQTAPPAIATVATVNGSAATVQSLELVDGRFPDYSRVIPDSGHAMLTIAVDPNYLMEVLKAAKEFTTDESRRVVLQFFGAENPFMVRSANPTQQFTGLVVPLVGRD